MTQTLKSYNIYYHDASIIINDDKPGDNVSFYIRSHTDMKRFIDKFIHSNTSGDVHLYGKTSKQLFDDFKNCFKYIKAAGGLVKNHKDQFLLIKRFGRWDIPKGKLKKKELHDEGAIRELQEETNVKGLVISSELPATFHIYLLDDQPILKKTYWYLMKTHDEGELKPQINEDITEACWKNREESIKLLNTSYRAIRDELLPCI